VWRCLY